MSNSRNLEPPTNSGPKQPLGLPPALRARLAWRPGARPLALSRRWSGPVGLRIRLFSFPGIGQAFRPLDLAWHRPAGTVPAPVSLTLQSFGYSLFLPAFGVAAGEAGRRDEAGGRDKAPDDRWPGRWVAAAGESALPAATGAWPKRVETPAARPPFFSGTRMSLERQLAATVGYRGPSMAEGRARGRNPEASVYPPLPFSPLVASGAGGFRGARLHPGSSKVLPLEPIAPAGLALQRNAPGIANRLEAAPGPGMPRPGALTAADLVLRNTEGLRSGTAAASANRPPRPGVSKGIRGDFFVAPPAVPAGLADALYDRAVSQTAMPGLELRMLPAPPRPETAAATPGPAVSAWTPVATHAEAFPLAIAPVALSRADIDRLVERVSKVLEQRARLLRERRGNC